MKKLITERTNLFEPNSVIIMTFDIININNEQLIKKALNQSFNTFETCLSRIVIDNDGNAYFDKLKESKCSIIKTNFNLQELINSSSRLKIEDGELMRVYISDNLNNSYKINIFAHHLVGDGKSIIYFIECFMKYLNNISTPYQEVMIINQKSMPSNSKPIFIFKLFASLFNKKWLKYNIKYDFNDLKEVYNNYYEIHKDEIIIKSLNNTQYNKLVNQAKLYNVSVNTLLLALFTKYRKTKKIGIAINIRRDNIKTMANLVSGITVNYKYNNYKSIEYNSKKIQKLIKFKLNNSKYKYFILHYLEYLSPTLIDSLFFKNKNKVSRKFNKVMGYENTNYNSLSVSNLGKLDIDTKYGEYEICNLYFVPPIVSYCYDTYGISSLNENMTMTYHYLKDRLDKNNINILDEMLNEIDNFKLN